MRTRYLHFGLFAILLTAGTNYLSAQKNTGFAITGTTKGNIAWTVIREIDLSTGAELRTIYAPTDKPTLVDALTGKKLQQLDPDAQLKDEVTITNSTGIRSTMVTFANGSRSEVVTAPTETFVAASALDSKNNRLFFTPMRSNELRYVDLNKGTGTIYYVRNVALKNFTERDGEEDVITRMCFGADGYGYALTNDGNHLIRFSSGDKITIKDLGAVQDGKDNNNISIRNKCTSWGGDMIADAYNNLYVITMRGNIFKINPDKMIADHIGSIKDLPQDYTINGAAVDAGGNIIVSCASKTDKYFSVDLTKLTATPLSKQQQQVFNASDLASCHVAYENNVIKPSVPAPVVKGNSLISVYPNPVTNRTVNISYDQLSKANHNIQVVDAAGKIVMNKLVNVDGKSVSQVILPKTVKSGMYVIKVTDATGKEQFSSKIVVY